MADALDDFVVSDSPDLPTEQAEKPVELPEPEPEPDEPEPDAASEAGKVLAAKKKSYQDRINAATWKQREAERERDEAKQEAARLKAEREGKPAEEKPKPAPQYLTRPKPSAEEIGTTYADWDAYNEDLIDWKTDEREAKRARETQSTEAEKAEREAVTQVQARIAVFKADHPDYDEIIASANIPNGSPAFFAIMHHLRYSELGPHLAYELGKDHTELARIASLPADKAWAALGRLEGKIEDRLAAAPAGPAANAPAVTRAKPPIKPVGSSPVTSDDAGDPDDLSPSAVDNYITRENAKARAAGRRR